MENLNKSNPNNIEDTLALSPIQTEMLLHYIENPESRQYYEQLTLNLTGSISTIYIKKAWDIVTQNNDMLRVVYSWDKADQSVQLLLKNHQIPFVLYDLTDLTDEDKEAEAWGIIEADAQSEIDIRTAPMRITLIRWDENNCQMILTHHHILFDGWSTGILLREFFEAYHSFCDGRTPPEKHKSRYRTFIDWQQHQSTGAQEAFWRSYLEGFTAKPFLPRMSQWEAGQAEGQEELVQYTRMADSHITEGIEQYTTANNITKNALLYGAWGILLQKHSQSDDVVFGTLVSGRGNGAEGIEEMVGLFAHTLPLRVKAESKETLFELLKKIDDSLKERTQNEALSLADIKGYSDLDSQEALFDSIVVMDNGPLETTLSGADSLIKMAYYNTPQMSKMDLVLSIEGSERLSVHFHYNRQKFTEETIHRLAEHFCNILSAIIQNPNQKLSEIQMFSEDEKNRLLTGFNDNFLLYPRSKTIHRLFEYRAAKTPQAEAVKYLDNKITYGELNQKANQLAKWLQSKGVRPGKAVGIMANRSIELIIGILGLWKAGGAYVPIHPDCPPEKARYMLEDSDAHILLTHVHWLDKVSFDGEAAALEDAALYPEGDEGPKPAGNPWGVAYIPYTFDTTDKPKGILLSHRALTNLLYNVYNTFEGGIGKRDNCLGLTDISHEASICELFLPLVFGGRLVLFNQDVRAEVSALARTIADEKVTFANIPSAILQDVFAVLKEEKESLMLTKILVNAEAAGDEALKGFMSLKDKMQIRLGYSMKEACGITTIYKYDASVHTAKSIPIGKTMGNTQAFILDKDCQLVPQGAVGELYIGGDGLAKGYIHQKELTAEKFVANPYFEGKKMYKTRRKARWNEAGELELLDSEDDGIRGGDFRLVLEEIEEALMAHPDIRKAVGMIGADKNGRKYLGAWVEGDDVDVRAVRFYLGRRICGRVMVFVG